MAAMFTSPCRVLSSIRLARCICNTSVSFTGKGIRGSVKGLGLREKELQELEAEDLENMTEASLDSFNQEAANIEGDVKRYQNHVRQKTIQRKYFKSRGLEEENLLTWSMKEQLKYLHSTDPDRWTPEVLSDSFPISPEGVARLLHSRWVPKSEAERQRHDRAVVIRWKRHMRGQLGSFKILEKTLKEKFIPENLPSPANGMNQILSLLDALVFDGDKPHVAKELKRKNKLPQQAKMKGKSFYSIVEDFKSPTSAGKRQPEESNSINSLAMIFGTPHYEGLYSKVIGGARTVKRDRYSCRESEGITFTEFMKEKV